MAEPQTRIPVAGHEDHDLGEGFIWWVVGICLAVLAASGLLVMTLYPGAVTERLITGPVPAYPTPRLQSDPAGDMSRFRVQEIGQIGAQAPMPIDEAMRRVATDGIAGWPAP